jgi:hypothetical protein
MQRHRRDDPRCVDLLCHDRCHCAYQPGPTLIFQAKRNVAGNGAMSHGGAHTVMARRQVKARAIDQAGNGLKREVAKHTFRARQEIERCLAAHAEPVVAVDNCSASAASGWHGKIDNLPYGRQHVHRTVVT